MKPENVTAILRCNFQGMTFESVAHVQALVHACNAAQLIGSVVVAVPDNAFHQAHDADLKGCAVLRGAAENMTRRMLEAMPDGTETVLDCSPVVQCLDGNLYDRLLAAHGRCGAEMTVAEGYIPHFLPKVVAATTLRGLADQPWPYYDHIATKKVNRFQPDLEQLAWELANLHPIAREYAFEKSRTLRTVANWLQAPSDPLMWLDRATSVVDALEKYLGRRDVSVLEIGCGRRFGLGPLLCMAGVKSYVGIDIRIHEPKAEELQLFDEFLRLHLSRLPRAGVVAEQLCSGPGEGLGFLGGRALCKPMDAAALDFPDNSFDYIFSDAVLEHIDSTEEAIAQMNRVLKPGGVMVHAIDFQDHAEPHATAHLSMSKKAWSKQAPSAINFCRPSEFYELFLAQGLEIISCTEVKNPTIDPTKVHPDHSKFGPSDVCTITCQLVLKKPSR